MGNTFGEYSWVALSLLSALSLATADALTKKALKGTDDFIVIWFRFAFSLPLLIAVAVPAGVPHTDAVFLRSFALAVPFEVLATVLYIKALRASPLSLTLPFLSFTPVFLIFFSFLIAGERVSGSGAAGILLVAAGSYLLYFHHAGKGLLEPFRAAWKERGSMMMLAVAAIYAVTSSLGKVSITHSSALFFGATYIAAVTLVFTPSALARIGKGGLRGANPRLLVLIGLMQGLMIIFHMLAMSLANVAYMIAVKRTSLVFGVAYGYLLFGETHMRERLTGTLMIFGGFLIIVLAG